MNNLFARKEKIFIHALFYCFAVLFAVIECGLFYPLSFFSVRPNLLLLLATFYSFYFSFKAWRVVLFCIVCGLLKDALSGASPGLHMVLFLCVGVALCFLSKRFLRYNWVFIIPLFVAATVICTVMYCILEHFFFSAHLPGFFSIWRIAFIELMYGLVIFAVFFKIIQRYVIEKLS